jgi:replicative DNA helicase
MISERIPPHNLEAEQALLGGCLIEENAIIRVADLLTPQDFYRRQHADIYDAMTSLWNRHEPIDIPTLANILGERGRLEAIGGRAFLIELTTVVSTAANIVSYAGIIQKKSSLRRLMTAASEIADLSFAEEEEADDVIDRAERTIMSVSNQATRTAFVSIKDTVSEAYERAHDLHENRGKLRGISTGFRDLDNKLGGLQKSDLIILAARPSVGKTALAMDIARRVAVKGKNTVGIFSLEMSKDQLVDRMLSGEAGVDLWNMRTGNLNDTGDNNDFVRIANAMGELAAAPIFIDDTPSLNIMQVRAKARRLQMEQGRLDLVIVDYLQLMESRMGKGNDNRTQEISEITRALKGLARELNTPVLALSQLSRAVEQGKPAIPKLSHLRESGSIEQDADIVMFIYRKTADKNYREDEVPLEDRNVAEIHIAKHRNGAIGDIKLYFDAARTSFRDLDTHHKPQ